MFRHSIFINILLLFTLCVCSCDSERRPSADTSDIHVEVEILPFFKDLAAIDTSSLTEGLQQVKAKYGDFFDFYWTVIVQADSSADPQSELLKSYFTHKDYRSLTDTVCQVYQDHRDVDESLLRLFRNIKYYDSTIPLPEKVIYINSFLNSPAFTWGSVLGIGFDMYFGEEFWPYESEAVNLPAFISRHNTRENIPVAAAKVLYSNVYPLVEQDRTLLELMVLNGKNILFLDHVLPDHSIAELLGFTDSQWKWCEENEKMIYYFFTNNNLIYEKNPVRIMRYIAPTPTSMGMPAESPGKTAVYTGYKIMKKYQAETGKTLAEILHEQQDAQHILKSAHYKPKN